MKDKGPQDKPQKYTINKAQEKLSIYEFSDMRRFLDAIYSELKTCHERYSYFTFSKDLGFKSNNIVHLMMQGKRRITEKSAIKLAEGIGLRGSKFEYFVACCLASDDKKTESRKAALEKSLKIKAKHFQKTDDQHTLQKMEFVDQWFTPVIREMVNFEDFKPNGEWIADQIRPRITPGQATQGFETLKRLGLIIFEEETKRWTQTEPQIKTSDQVQNLQAISYYEKTIPLGVDSLLSVDENNRLVNGYVLHVDEKKFQEIKELINRLDEKIFEIESSQQDVHDSNSERVVLLNMQLFPVTTNRRNKKGKSK